MNTNEKLKQSILSILKFSRASGYTIVHTLRSTPGCSVPEYEGDIYPVLHQLEKDNLIRSRLEDIQQGFERNVYHLTFQGRRVAGKLSPIPVIEPRLEPLPELHDMSIRIIRLRRWSMDAVLGINVSPDREIIAQELYDHLYDKLSSLLRQGIPPEEAEKRTCEEMGNYRDLAQALGRIHKPFWTKALRICRYVMAVLALITVVCYGFHFLDTKFLRNTIVDFDPDSPPLIAGTHQLLWEDRPGVSDTSDGYTIRAYRAALWETTSLDDETRVVLNIQLRTSNPIPWAERPDYADFIWARDSLGNTYLSAAEDTPAREPALQMTQYHTGTVTYVQDIWIFQYVSQDAQWIDLYYDRSGRNIALRIDLPGGE